MTIHRAEIIVPPASGPAKVGDLFREFSVRQNQAVKIIGAKARVLSILSRYRPDDKDYALTISWGGPDVPDGA